VSAMSLLSVAELRVRLGGLDILHGVSFEVAATGVTALLGRNGAGKTTTLRAIMGLAPASGSVTFDGLLLNGLRAHTRVQRGLGYVPEDRCVFAGLTVAENLRLAEKGKAERGKPDYDRVFELFPELSKRSGQKAGSLSGGQQQMLSLGRVLLNDNRLLVVDEPTKGLAPKVVTEVAAALERVALSVPVLLVEQNLAVVRRLAAQAIVLSGGRARWTGAAADLLGDAALTKSLLGVGH
jgi:branched-chain amino acid transport system ATP-binding protein